MLLDNLGTSEPGDLAAVQSLAALRLKPQLSGLFVRTIQAVCSFSPAFMEVAFRYFVSQDAKGNKVHAISAFQLMPVNSDLAFTCPLQLSMPVMPLEAYFLYVLFAAFLIFPVDPPWPVTLLVLSPSSAAALVRSRKLPPPSLCVAAWPPDSKS